MRAAIMLPAVLFAIPGLASCATGQRVKTLAQATAAARQEQSRRGSNFEPPPPLLIVRVEAAEGSAER